MTIKNTPTTKTPQIEQLRQAFEHRATWFYLLLDAARKQGIDWEKMGRSAVFRCGSFFAEKKHPPAETLEEFSRFFPSETGKQVFEMEIKTDLPHQMEIEFHYCPLVAAWQKLGIHEEEIALLCDMAMEGDRGIVASYPRLSMELQGTIAAGEKQCLLVIKGEEGP